MTHRTWVTVSGIIWLGIGVFLLYKGLRFISEGIISSHSLSFHMQSFFGSQQQSATALIAAGLIVGFIKGRFVLSKTVKRVSLRIFSLPLPIQWSSVYAPSYFILIGSMIALGVGLRFLPLPVDFRGFIDIAIGSALINGAMIYFRVARGALRV